MSIPTPSAGKQIAENLRQGAAGLIAATAVKLVVARRRLDAFVDGAILQSSKQVAAPFSLPLEECFEVFDLIVDQLEFFADIVATEQIFGSISRAAESEPARRAPGPAGPTSLWSARLNAKLACAQSKSHCHAGQNLVQSCWIHIDLHETHWDFVGHPSLNLTTPVTSVLSACFRIRRIVLDRRRIGVFSGGPIGIDHRFAVHRFGPLSQSGFLNSLLTGARFPFGAIKRRSL
jgi:hypothetical protein